LTSEQKVAAARTVRPDVPNIPHEYRKCFGKLAALPEPKGGWTLPTLTRAMTNIRKSEIQKDECGSDFIQWVDGVLTAARG
jgi:hypothetical protein